MKVFTKIHLLQALKKARLPSSYKSLLDLERRGIIPRGGELESIDNDRFYTKEEIEDIVKKVKASKNK